MDHLQIYDAGFDQHFAEHLTIHHPIHITIADLPASDRVAFGTLSTFLTGMRGLGYYREYLTGSTGGDDGSIPRLDPDD